MSDLLILDGGTGRELARSGAPFRQPEWSALALIEAPDKVAKVHRAYIDAGADIITTNSYAVVPFHIGEARFAQRGAELAALSGRLARAAVSGTGGSVAVAGSLPPVGGSYRPDLVDLNRARPVLATLVAALAPHVDQWQAETLSTLAEAELVADLVAFTAKPLWLSFTLRDETPGLVSLLRSGETVAAATAAVLRLGAAALLFNCSRPEVMAAAVAVARVGLAGSGIRIGVYANAFPSQTADAEANVSLDDIRADLTPEGYSRFARAWIGEGASIVGGCCGIGPEHIAQLAALRSSQNGGLR